MLFNPPGQVPFWQQEGIWTPTIYHLHTPRGPHTSPVPFQSWSFFRPVLVRYDYWYDYTGPVISVDHYTEEELGCITFDQPMPIESMRRQTGTLMEARGVSYRDYGFVDDQGYLVLPDDGHTKFALQGLVIEESSFPRVVYPIYNKVVLVYEHQPLRLEIRDCPDRSSPPKDYLDSIRHACFDLGLTLDVTDIPVILRSDLRDTPYSVCSELHIWPYAWRQQTLPQPDADGNYPHPQPKELEK